MNKLVSRNMNRIRVEPMSMATQKTGRCLKDKHMAFVHSMKKSMFGTNFTVKEKAGKRHAGGKNGRAEETVVEIAVETARGTAEKTGSMILAHGDTGYSFVGDKDVKDNDTGDRDVEKNEIGENVIRENASEENDKIDGEAGGLQIMEIDEDIIVRMRNHLAEFFGGGDA